MVSVLNQDFENGNMQIAPEEENSWPMVGLYPQCISGESDYCSIRLSLPDKLLHLSNSTSPVHYTGFLLIILSLKPNLIKDLQALTLVHPKKCSKLYLLPKMQAKCAHCRACILAMR